MEITNIFVIVVTYNGKQWYDRCFGSLRRSEVQAQVVAVDNASTDDTVEYLQTHFPEVHLITSDVNLGFGQGNNKGIRYALEHDAEYVFLLNQDAWIESNTLAVMVETHKKYPEYGLLSPMHLNADKTAIERGLLTFLTYHEHINLELISDFYIGLKKEVYDVLEVNAAAWLLPQKTLEIVGGFDPLFYHYAEDDNYFSRVLYHGFKAGLIPKVTICHDTERRVKATPKAAMAFDKWLLQRSTDLLYPDNHIHTMIKEYLKLAIVKALTFHWATFRENYRNALFLIRNKKKIMHSREINKQVGRTWL